MIEHKHKNRWWERKIPKGKFYIYAHYTVETKELFYIGKGSGDRAFRGGKTNRNDRWFKIAEKYGGFTVVFLYETNDEKEAFDKEEFFVAMYKPKANLAKGGFGPIGVSRSDESKQKIGASRRGKGASKKHRQRISDGMKSAYKEGRRKSIAGTIKDRVVREKISISQGGKPFRVYDVFTGELLGQWINCAECSKDIGLNRNSVWLCVTGKQKISKNFRFEIIEQSYTEED